MKITDKYVFFVATNECFSNWHPARFSHQGKDFKNSEQAMMYAKAKLFSDNKTMRKILDTPNPKKVKDLGREVQNYVEETWSQHRQKLVTEILLDKFKQNIHMKKQLLETGDKILVEAAHYDKIWGVGLRQDDPLILDEKNWKGLNLLGKCLMSVREILKVEIEQRQSINHHRKAGY